MRHLLFIVLFIGINIDSKSQELTSVQKDKISSEINALFEKSIKSGENLDISAITGNVNDTLKTGFIDNGYYFSTFNEVIKGFNKGVKGCKSQKMEIINKKLTILSDKIVLLTAFGNYSATLDDGRILNGKFAWTFVYSKINDTWKVIHSHMSNPR